MGRGGERGRGRWGETQCNNFLFTLQEKLLKMRTLFIIILSFTAACLSLHSQEADSTKFQSVEPKAFHAKFLQENNPILIDVREYFEFRKSRIKGAVNIPSSGGYDTPADTIKKESALFFYCYSGGRSKKAALFFYNKGFRNLYSLKGGITLWKKEGLPVVRKRLRKYLPSVASQSSQYTSLEYRIRC